MQCKYYQILLRRTCKWSLWTGGHFIEVVFKTGSTVILSEQGFAIGYKHELWMEQRAQKSMVVE